MDRLESSGCPRRGRLSSDNYNSFSGDSYFSRSFWGKSARAFVSFWGGFLLALVPGFGRPGVAAKGRHQRRAEGYPPALIVGDRYGDSFVSLCFMALCAVSLAVKFQDDRVMDQPVDCRHRRHRILEDFVPLAEHQVGADQHAASFITFGKKGKKYFHLFSALLHVAQVIEDDRLKAVEFFKCRLQCEAFLGLQ